MLHDLLQRNTRQVSYRVFTEIFVFLCFFCIETLSTFTCTLSFFPKKKEMRELYVERCMRLGCQVQGKETTYHSYSQVICLPVQIHFFPDTSWDFGGENSWISAYYWEMHHIKWFGAVWNKFRGSNPFWGKGTDTVPGVHDIDYLWFAGMILTQRHAFISCASLCISSGSTSGLGWH